MPDLSTFFRRCVRAALFSLALLTIETMDATADDSKAETFSPPSVFLEDLTWTETRAALSAGYDAVIIPTGGTEQNGPHAALGKHNFIVRETSERIALALGDTLVAPVLAYVPEGDPGPSASGHMQWSGTLSLPENVFLEVLVAAARSYHSHGFRTIYLLGDSGGNQAMQAEAASRLTREWEDEGVTVLHVGEYYAKNGQVEWLRAQGFSDAQIGNHASLRDTSELLAVRTQSVRTKPLPPPDGMHPGFDGDPNLATAEIGRMMLTLKVNAALRQIRGRRQTENSR